MELSEAHRTIDATAGFLLQIQGLDNANLLAIEDDAEGLGVLGVKVYTTTNISHAERRCRLKYRSGEEFEFIIPQIAPVCDLIIDNWPSPSAKKLRSHIDESNVLYLANEILGLDDPMMDETVPEAYEYQAMSFGTNRIRYLFDEIYDINYRLAYALRMTEDEKPAKKLEYSVAEEKRNYAKEIDWVRATNNFNLNSIKDVVKTGRNKHERRNIIKAIRDAMVATGEMYKIPYSVDNLLMDLFKENDGSRKGLLKAYDESNETLYIDEFIQYAIEEYMYRHSVTDTERPQSFDTPPAPSIAESDKNSNITLDSTPDDLKSPEAEQLMQKLINAGIMNEEWQPVNLSIAERGYLADEISSRLKIKSKWKVMGALWNENSETLRQGKNKAVEQTKTGAFIDKLKKILN